MHIDGVFIVLIASKNIANLRPNMRAQSALSFNVKFSEIQFLLAQLLNGRSLDLLAALRKIDRL